MNEAQTCPRRVTEIGPWKQDPNLDHWQKVGNDRVCSFCGSLHPDEFETFLHQYLADKTGEIHLETTDKPYKVYARRPGIANAGEGAIKFFKWHVSDDPDWLARIEAIWPAVMEKHAAHLRKIFGIDLPAQGTGE
jgi:hypothetical protein